MSNEAVLMWETELAVPINILDANAIPKGTVLQLADLFVGSASSAADQTFGGITKIEKIALDGNTKVAAYFGGIFKMVVGAAGCTVGFDVALAGANTIVDADTLDDEEGLKVGKALETGTSGETVLVFVGK